jgi:hypothetical protein
MAKLIARVLEFSHVKAHLEAFQVLGFSQSKAYMGPLIIKTKNVQPFDICLVLLCVG